MSKVIIYRSVIKDSLPVASATISTGWLPGQVGTLDSTGANVELAITDETMFLLADDEDELNAPPTGSLVTCLYGSGTKVEIDHSEEVAASSASRAYESNVESAVPGQSLYVSSNGKWTTTATGSVYAKVVTVPSATNNYTLGLITRF
jgi:hypothetical protein